MSNISLLIVKSVIKDELNMGDLPLDETFKNLGFEQWHLERIRHRFAKAFDKNIMPSLSETVYSYTDRLLNA